VETTPYVAAPAAPGYPTAAPVDPVDAALMTPVGEPAIVSIGGGAPAVAAPVAAPATAFAPETLAPPAYAPVPDALLTPDTPASFIPEPPAAPAHEPAHAASYPDLSKPPVPESYVPEHAAPVAAPVEPAPVEALPAPVSEPLVAAAPAGEPLSMPAPSGAPLEAPTASVTEAPAPAAYPATSYPAPVTAAAPVVAPAPALPTPDSRPHASSVTIGHEPMVGRQSTEQGVREEDFSLAEALNRMLERGASDLHLTSAARPTIRVSGSLVPLDDFDVLTPPVLQRVIYAILTQAQRLKFEEQLELDFAYSLPGRARFRVNVYKQRDSVGAAFRIIPFEIKSLESLGIPPSVANFANLPRGFVLVTGPTGSGKSTTLASVVDLANRTRHDHIMTVEDPIEFLHRHKSCLVNQREVGEDTWSFSNALKHVLRQDPDIILVGEMRDLETISVALTAAETGHLVFATLHTQDAAQTIDRIIDVFPPHQQTQVRAQLAMALQGVVCQTLAKSSDGHGRVVATEVLVVTPAVRNLIREGKTHQIYSVMQAGAAHGMHTLDQHLAELVRTRRITYEVGIEKCHHIEDFNRLCGRA